MKNAKLLMSSLVKLHKQSFLRRQESRKNKESTGFPLKDCGNDGKSNVLVLMIFLLNKSVHCSLFTVHPSPNPLPQGEGTRGRDGFTLIEVIVAIAVLAISLTMVMQLFSGGLRLSRASCDYTRAIVHAKDKMEELYIDPVQGSGEFEDGFKWESEVSPAEEPQETPDESDINLLKLKVKIFWSNIANQQKSVELVSLKTAEKEK